MTLSQPVVEGIKEFVRMAMISVLPILIDSLSAGVFNLRLTLLAVSIAVLRALDKWLHEKDVRTPLDLKGLDSLGKK